MNPNVIPAPFTVSMTPRPSIPRSATRNSQVRFCDSDFIDALLKIVPLAKDGFDPFANGWNAAMKFQAEHSAPRRLPMPVNVIFHNPATIVYWNDGDKTVVKCQPGDTFSAEAGLTAAMLKKYMGNDNTFNKVINEWLARASYASVPALPEATE